MVENIYLGNASIIIGECIEMLFYGFLNLEIEGDSKIAINCFNRKSS